MKDAIAIVPNPHWLMRWGDTLTICVGTTLLLTVWALIATVLVAGVGML